MATPDAIPSEADFILFCRNVAGITTTVMPDGDPGFDYAYAFALQWIPQTLNCVSGVMYTAAIYNWGVSLLIEFQQDQVGQTFFADLRKQFGTSNFVPGVISTTADQATSDSLTIGTALSNMNLIDLQRATDPFGRRALAMMSALGPYWGLS